MTSYQPASNLYQPRRNPSRTGWSGPGYSPFERGFDSATSDASTTAVAVQAPSTAQTRGRRGPCSFDRSVSFDRSGSFDRSAFDPLVRRIDVESASDAVGSRC